MNRYEAIKAVSDAILKDGLAEALFLKGSIARGEDDDYSDVDFYVVVTDANFEPFLKRRIGYLETYKPLINWVEVNFVGPQIVGIFDDALHFDLYTVKSDAIPQTGAIKILYDKKGMLKNYENKPLSLTVTDLSRYVSEFIYLLIEIEVAYARGDLLRCMSLFYMNYGHLGLLTRYLYDKESSLLGNKGMYKVIPKEIHQEHLEMLEYATPSHVLKAIKWMLKSFEKTIQQLPEVVQSKMNKPYYTLLRTRIDNLSELSLNV